MSRKQKKFSELLSNNYVGWSLLSLKEFYWLLINENVFLGENYFKNYL